MVDWHVVIIFCWHFFVRPDGKTFMSWMLTILRYVAMHAMQDDSANHDHPASNGFTDPGLQRKHPRPQMRDTFAAVAGMLLPMLTQLSHSH